MAANDTAALVVALSAQVSKFEKDMRDANGIAEKGVKKIEGTFAAAGAAIERQLRTLAAIAGSAFGPAGSIVALLATMGPAGLAAAAGLGTLALAFSFISDKVEAFAEKAKRLKDASDTTGLTVNQLRLLFEVGKNVGVDPDQTEKFIERLAISLEKLKTTGGGELFDALARIDVGLVRNVASAKDLAAAIDILQRAFHGLKDEGQKLELIGAIAGRRNLGAGRILDSLAEQGGFQKLQEDAAAAGKSIDKLANDQIVALKREVEDLKRKTDNVYGRMFALDTLEAQKRSAELWLQLALNAEKFAQAARDSVGAADAGQRQATQFGRRFRGLDRAYGASDPDQVGPNNEEIRQKLLQLGQSRIAAVSDQVGVGSIPLPPSRPDTGKGSAATELELMKRWTSLLGEAITPAEALKLKILELTVAQEKGGVSDQVRARVLAAFALAQGAAALSARERLGIAREEEITEQRLAELSAQRAKGFVKNADEMATAERIIAREAKATAEAQQVRASKFPELTRNLLDAQNATKQFDQIATSSLNSAADAFADVVTGTKSVSDAVRDMVNSILRDVARAAFKSAIASLFGGATGGGSFLSGLFGGHRAMGGPVTAGTPFAVGENGPELFVPNQSGAIVPNDVLRRGGAGAPQIFITNHVDATGADVAAISRLTTGLAMVNRSIESRAVAALNAHRTLRG